MKCYSGIHSQETKLVLDKHSVKDVLYKQKAYFDVCYPTLIEIDNRHRSFKKLVNRYIRDLIILTSLESRNMGARREEQRGWRDRIYRAALQLKAVCLGRPELISDYKCCRVEDYETFCGRSIR